MLDLDQRRRRRWWLAPVIVGGLVLAFYLIAAPRVQSVSPEPGSTDLPDDEPIRISFSTSMDRASVSARLSVEPHRPGEFRWQGNTLIFTPEADWPAGAEVQVQLGAGARSSLYLPMLAGESWSFFITQPRVSYLQREEGSGHLYAQPPGGEAQRLLPDLEGSVVDYAWSEAGELALLVEQGDGGVELSVRPVGSEDLRVIHACPAEVRCREVAISPDGAWLAWEQQTVSRGATGVVQPGTIHVWTMPVDATSPASAVVGGQTDRHSPHWVEGGRLAYYDVARSALVLAARLGSSWQEITSIEQSLGEHWAWSPDGRFVVFPEVVFLDGEESSDFFSHLYRVEWETGLRTDLSQSSGELVEDASPSYSPDGLWIAFARKSLQPAEWTLGRQLWLMRSDGSEARALTDAPDHNHAEIGWGAESEAMVYLRFDQSAPEREREIWWADRQGQRREMLVEGGYAPRWIPQRR